MTLTELAVSVLMALIEGSQASAFFEDMKEKRLRSLKGRFDGSEGLVGATCGKGYSPGLMW
jgi:hypothetical protein